MFMPFLIVPWCNLNKYLSRTNAWYRPGDIAQSLEFNTEPHALEDQFETLLVIQEDLIQMAITTDILDEVFSKLGSAVTVLEPRIQSKRCY